MNPVNAQVSFHIANGGYIVQGWVKNFDDDEFSSTTSVFTDLDVALAYVRRVVIGCEGPADLAYQEKIGGMGVTP